MKKGSKFWIYFIPLILIVCFGIFTILEKNKQEVKEEKSDSVKIKEEYEELNNSYGEVKIGEQNAFVYASLKDVKTIFDEGDGIIFLGTPSSFAARKTIVLLNDVINTTSIEKVYYIDTKTMDSDLNILLLNKLEIVKVNPGTIITVQGGKILNNYSLYHKYENRNELSEDEKEATLSEYKNIVGAFVEACDENC